MKLRNKHTGEIIKVNNGRIHIFFGDNWLTFTSLKQLNDTWEDYDETQE